MKSPLKFKSNLKKYSADFHDKSEAFGPKFKERTSGKGSNQNWLDTKPKANVWTTFSDQKVMKFLLKVKNKSHKDFS